MASAARQKAIASGKIVENAEAVRRRLRSEAAQMREELAIELFAKGKTNREIADELERQYGVRMVKNLPELIRRGLNRRAEANRPNVDAARELLLHQYRALLEVYLPRALGGEPDPETGLPSPPDLRAAEFALKVLDKTGIVTGALAPPRAGDVNVHLHGAPVDADDQRAVVLRTLEVERAKQREIEGALAGTPAAEDTVEVSDGMIMPPIPAAPQERG